MSKAKVILPKEGLQVTVVSGNHTYFTDEPVQDGGTDTGPTPTQMVMGALGSCIAITMRLYADRKGWALEGVELDLDFERFRSKDYPAYEGNERYIHEITKKITLHGPLTDEQKERIIQIGGMCPVHRLIASPAFFVEEVLEQEQSAEAKVVDEMLDTE